MNECFDVSIEFSHLYADQAFGREQARSLQILRGERTTLESRGLRVSSVVLLDDLHISHLRTTVEDTRASLLALGEDVDAVIPESALRAGAKRMIKTLPRQALFYEPFRRAAKRVLFARTPAGPIALGSITKRPFEPTCALLVATWSLARLGRIEVPGVPAAERVISIVGERYRDVERKALALVSLSRFAGDTERISHRFYREEEAYVSSEAQRGGYASGYQERFRRYAS